MYALLALATSGANAEAAKLGMKWLSSLQRPDGGWPPSPSVDQSTWVTALVLLLLADPDPSPAVEKAAGWLLKQSGRESAFLRRLRLRLLGVKDDTDTNLKGWPWYPDTAAWVTPTALTILALEKVHRRKPSEILADRIETGRRFLLSRMCADGGWNHGSSRALGYEAGSYPETTGMALLALHALPPHKLDKSFTMAERHLHTCRSAEGLSWLQLGLLAHSRLGTVPQPPAECRSTMNASLAVLVEAASRGRNVFLG
ncbi:MAG: prenyltransferase/squalene oxidase repeat-containing protein [Candidatus Hodarchaeota archaeon]